MKTGTWNMILNAGLTPAEGEKWSTPAQVASRVDISTATAKKYLNEMVERGLVRSWQARRTPSGRGRIVYQRVGG